MGFEGRSIILGIAVCLAAIYVPKIYWHFVSNRYEVNVFNHSPGPCRIVPDIECGSEDIAITQDGLAFISNGFRGINTRPPSILKGNIYLFDFNDPDKNATRLSIISDTMNMDVFHPHGLSIWENSNGEVLLFVVDHGNKTETVKIYSFDRKKRNVLIHIETIYDESFRCLNDLVAIGPRQFYATNYLYSCATFRFELALLLSWGSVTYYNGSNGRIVAEGLTIPNGINISPDGRYIYVACTMLQELLIYERKKDEEIQLYKIFKVNSNVDNINVDQNNGDLYLGAHRHVDRVLLADYNGTLPAPSQVLRVREIGKDWSNAEVTEILSNDGQNFVRASSVGSYYKGQLLVGSIYHRLGYCKVINKQDWMMP